MGLIQREGKDHDPVCPWVWATIPLRSDPVEIVSYPIPAAGSETVIDRDATIMARMKVGDPTSIREIPFHIVACFDSDRHEWHDRRRTYYSDNPTVFHFTDELC